MMATPKAKSQIQVDTPPKTTATRESPVNPSGHKPPHSLVKHYGTISAAIRELAAGGKTTSQIAKELGIKYQHAYNVLKRPLKRQLAKQRRE